MRERETNLYHKLNNDVKQINEEINANVYLFRMGNNLLPKRTELKQAVFSCISCSYDEDSKVLNTKPYTLRTNLGQQIPVENAKILFFSHSNLKSDANLMIAIQKFLDSKNRTMEIVVDEELWDKESLLKNMNIDEGRIINAGVFMYQLEQQGKRLGCNAKDLLANNDNLTKIKKYNNVHRNNEIGALHDDMPRSRTKEDIIVWAGKLTNEEWKRVYEYCLKGHNIVRVRKTKKHNGFKKVILAPKRLAELLPEPYKTDVLLKIEK